MTPPYPGWVSDAGVFGRAAAEVIAAETGSPKLPSGVGLPLWRTYRQAANEAGYAGLDEGTQTTADSSAGLGMGSEVGKKAWALAQRYFAGTAR